MPAHPASPPDLASDLYTAHGNGVAPAAVVQLHFHTHYLLLVDYTVMVADAVAVVQAAEPNSSFPPAPGGTRLSAL